MQESSKLSPIYLNYNENVYKSFKKKPSSNWLEEALANYRAYRSLESRLEGLCSRGLWKEEERQTSLDFVKEWMDLSPGGYKDWRQGYDPLIHRKFCNQITTAKKNPTKPHLPLEGLLRDKSDSDSDGKLAALGVTVKTDDIPIFFEDGSLLSGVLFPAPKRRKIVKGFKTLGYRRVNKKRGKGSHEWYENFGDPRKNRIAKSFGWDSEGKEMDVLLNKLTNVHSVNLPRTVKKGLLNDKIKSFGMTADQFLQLS